MVIYVGYQTWWGPHQLGDMYENELFWTRLVDLGTVSNLKILRILCQDINNVAKTILL